MDSVWRFYMSVIKSVSNCILGEKIYLENMRLTENHPNVCAPVNHDDFINSFSFEISTAVFPAFLVFLWP